MKDRYVIVQGWEKFQHYKDRDPTWIKNYVDLLDRDEYMDLTPPQRAVLHGLWLAYARRRRANGLRISSLNRTLGMRVTSTQIAALSAAGFIELAAKPEEIADEKWPSRYVSADLRQKILARDGNRCKSCGSDDNLEIDHIIPVSRGGIGVEDNLQTLCRKCNRAKRTRPAEQRATQIADPRSLETETEEERETEALGERADGPLADNVRSIFQPIVRKRDGTMPYTGCRVTKGTNGVGYVRDILGVDRPPADWKHEWPSAKEIADERERRRLAS